jgi:hypothetical protein
MQDTEEKHAKGDHPVYIGTTQTTLDTNTRTERTLGNSC